LASYKFHTLDVFTSKPFAGNPLAVVLDADDLSDEQMQTVAREFNLSETIFVQKPDNPDHTAKVRIFFPTAEIPFAGHPTIGCAVLLTQMAFEGDDDIETIITLEEVAGLVPVKIERAGGAISAQFVAPVVPYPVKTDEITPELVASALGINTDAIGWDEHSIGIHQGGPIYLYVPLKDQESLDAIWPCNPHWDKLRKLSGTNSVYAYRKIENETSMTLRARMLSPDDGVPEDPATGSASAILASQLQSANELHPGTNNVTIHQGVEMGRPSEIGLEVDLDGEAISAVRVRGTAVNISSGVILI